MGSFISRILVLAFGYAYPAYECYKTVELNKPEIEQLRFWCQYWILVALLAIVEFFFDTIISWLPMYREAKLAFYIYLWYPKSKGAIYIYDTYFKPYISEHETEIDRNLLELKTRTGDMLLIYTKTIASYGQTTIFQILDYAVSQSQAARVRFQKQRAEQVGSESFATPPVNQPAATQRPLKAQIRGFQSTSIHQVEKVKKSGESESTVQPPENGEVEKVKKSGDPELAAQPLEHGPKMQTDAADSETAQDKNTPPDDILMEETIDASHNGLRKRSANAAVTESSNQEN